MKYPFSENEMKVRFVIPGTRGRIDVPVFDGPVSAAECLQEAMNSKRPPYMPVYRYMQNFTPRINPDNEARGFVFDGGAPLQHPEGFKDMFGVNWIFIPMAGGSMVQPGKPMLEDMNDWENVLVWPDIDSWDWEGQRERSREYLGTEEIAVISTILNGYFERMISLMDFEGAAMALIDEEQKDAVHAFLDHLADFYVCLIDRYIEYFPELKGFTVHDDWGSQRAPFFSLDTVREMLVPPMKRVCEHIHAKGRFYDMHCCGQVEDLIPAMIEIGVDAWSGQPMNDKGKLYHLYGDRILIGVDTPPVTAGMPDEEVSRIAKAYTEEFMEADRVAMVGYTSQIECPSFYEYLYRFSREKALELAEQ